MDQFFPDTAKNVWEVLEKYGCEVLYPLKQTCCGQAAYNAGYEYEARRTGEHFLKCFESKIPIVAPSASCVGYIREQLQKSMLPKNSLLRNIRFFEFTEFLVHQLKVNISNVSFAHKVAYHSSCSSLRECNLSDTPINLLQQVQELELIEIKDHTVCCGFGGTFSIKFPDISASMGEEKIMHAINTGAAYITSVDMSCLMHLQGIIDKKKFPIQTIHIADILNHKK